MKTSSARLRMVAFSAVILAVLPYVTLKVMWLMGSTLGLTPGLASNHMQDPRLVVGNAITIGLEIIALGLAVALIKPWGRRVPGWLVLLTAGGATGLLAPVLLGLPPGLILQLLVDGTMTTGDEGGMRQWVFIVVYSSFGLLAMALACLFAIYAGDRWRRLLSHQPQRPPLRLVLACSPGIVVFGTAMISWGVTGPGDTGPQGLTSIAQRTPLIATGILALLGWAVPLLPKLMSLHPRAAWLAMWTGVATAALQGPAHILLAHGGIGEPIVTTLPIIATLSASVYGLSVLSRAHPARVLPTNDTAGQTSSTAAPAIG
ncbi:hypothetical protein M3B51_14670 [Kocuria carniphila]|uniref:hypothetical protein n=1 Tax=Kocuria carniphila TaxID=262208 RepID=UPI0021A55AF8|nr:hypothetical protein [Kocuria carniphila]MCT1804020.1 hypothetical protein [Kocuria carniphila]